MAAWQIYSAPARGVQASATVGPNTSPPSARQLNSITAFADDAPFAGSDVEQQTGTHVLCIVNGKSQFDPVNPGRVVWAVRVPPGEIYHLTDHTVLSDIGNSLTVEFQTAPTGYQTVAATGT